MDCRHKLPIISLAMCLDPANPLVYFALGVVTAIVAMMVLVAV